MWRYCENRNEGLVLIFLNFIFKIFIKVLYTVFRFVFLLKMYWCIVSRVLFLKYWDDGGNGRYGVDYIVKIAM